ncbi:MAG: TRAP transporter large permease subunit [Desulfocapsaceae bacterium]|jgi:tripartite ATP-independent transporter DctM subunit|nr:TRAP transporter large permease subunit [Desulfocapsaceae bacterium]
MIELSPQFAVFLMFSLMLLGLLVGHPLAFVLGGVGAMVGFVGWGPGALFMMVSRTYSTLNNQILIAIPLFVLMAVFLEKSGIAEGLFTAMMHLFGKLRGGVALTVTILSVVFAATTGVVGASVVSMSLMSIPVMMKYKYDKQLAAGVVISGGTLGILIPPSIMLILMADQSGQSVGRLFAGAFIPGVLLGTLYFMYVLILALLHPERAPALTDKQKGEVNKMQLIRMLLINFIPPILLILGVLGTIWLGVATPTEASGVGAFIAFMLMIVYGKFSWKTLFISLKQALVTNAMVMATIIGASIFTGVFLGLGGGDVVTEIILSMEGFGKWGIFAMMMFIIFILGFLIDWIGIIFISFPIFLPIANEIGFDPTWFVVILAINLQMSFLTPPVGYSLFYLKGSVDPKVINLGQIYRGIIPFVFLQMIGLLLCILFPSTVTFMANLVG